MDDLTAWQRTGHARDGAEYRIRPIRPDDLERERAFILGLSPDSRYNRLLCAVREPSPALLDHFVHVDYHREMAFVAVVGEGPAERIIAVARYGTMAGAAECEFAVVVADEWQARGVGTTLTRLLFAYARTQGFRRVLGGILASNERMLKFVASLGMRTQRSSEDAALLIASLDLTG